MKITKEQPPTPPAEYVLRLSYPELHRLTSELRAVITTRSGNVPQMCELFTTITGQMITDHP